MNDRNLDAWYAGLSDEQRSYVQTATTVQIVRQFSDQARARCEDAEANLLLARARRIEVVKRLDTIGDNEDGSPNWPRLRELRAECQDAEHHVTRCTIAAAVALEYLQRTTATLEQAIRLHAMGPGSEVMRSAT
jgi:hypothetical protein